MSILKQTDTRIGECVKRYGRKFRENTLKILIFVRVCKKKRMFGA